MEFGRVTDEELPFIDFTLPPDPAFTTQTLQRLIKASPCKYM
jgi:hypothetical protein